MAAMLRASFRVANLTHCKDYLRVTWHDGAVSKLPNIWLRSAVRDPNVFNAQSCVYNQAEHARFITTESPIIHAETDERSEDIKVHWTDHVTSFNASWLRARDSSNNKSLLKDQDLVLWDAESSRSTIKTYQYNERKETLESWLTDMRRYGIAYFQGVPSDEEGLTGILNCVGQTVQRIHPSNVAIILTDSKTAARVDSNAYGPKPHSVHTDTAHYLQPVRLSCLLCTEYSAPEQDTINFFVDSLKIVDDIRKEEPEAYSLLKNSPVRVGRRRLNVEEECPTEDVYMYHTDRLVKKELIQYDKMENRLMFTLSNGTAGFDMDFFKDPKDIKRYYEAFTFLYSKFYDPKYQHQVILKKGCAAVFNNYRVAHGRGQVHPSTSRELKLAFISDEMWRTRWRVRLGEKSGLDNKWLFACTEEELEILAQRYEIRNNTKEINEMMDQKAT